MFTHKAKITFKLKGKVKEGYAETSCVLTILVDIVVVKTELLMSIHRTRRYGAYTSASLWCDWPPLFKRWIALSTG